MWKGDYEPVKDNKCLHNMAKTTVSSLDLQIVKPTENKKITSLRNLRNALKEQFYSLTKTQIKWLNNKENLEYFTSCLRD
jgi:hypothetical protein